MNRNLTRKSTLGHHSPVNKDPERSGMYFRRSLLTLNLGFFSSLFFSHYLNISCKLVIAEDVNGFKFSNMVELEFDLDRLPIPGIVFPADPSLTCKQKKKKYEIEISIYITCVTYRWILFREAP